MAILRIQRDITLAHRGDVVKMVSRCTGKMHGIAFSTVVFTHDVATVVVYEKFEEKACMDIVNAAAITELLCTCHQMAIATVMNK